VTAGWLHEGSRHAPQSNIWAPLLSSAPVQMTCETILEWHLEVQQCCILEEVRVLSRSTHFGLDDVKSSLLAETNSPCDSSGGNTTPGTVTAIVSAWRTGGILPLACIEGSQVENPPQLIASNLSLCHI